MAAVPLPFVSCTQSEVGAQSKLHSVCSTEAQDSYSALALMKCWPCLCGEVDCCSVCYVVPCGFLLSASMRAATVLYFFVCVVLYWRALYLAYMHRALEI